ncbi:D-alanine--poly(phosphoribitol) ligase subunit DltC, partial [Xanthomonas citri pv. citri]|nr:D-alanine--poly(phosphoribitol) ligase subunit DltC [Xanthomonas citri pv. citri]
MDFKQEVLDVLAEVCQDDIVKENPDIEIFEEGLLDSFGTVELLLAIENRFDILVPI